MESSDCAYSKNSIKRKRAERDIEVFELENIDQMISLTTNSTMFDEARLLAFIPRLVKTFDNYFDELLIIHDIQKPEGRIALLHNYSNEEVKENEFLDYISSIDERIRIVKFDSKRLKETSKFFFKKEGINRCSDGTPISAFLYGIKAAKNNLIFRADCDVFFYDNGFIKNALKVLKEGRYILVQPPSNWNSFKTFSTRAFFIDRLLLEQTLPINLHRHNIFNLANKILKNKYSNPFLSLEGILQKQYGSQVYFQQLSLGNMLHVCTSDEFLHQDISTNLDAFCEGNIPDSQTNTSINYISELWN